MYRNDVMTGQALRVHSVDSLGALARLVIFCKLASLLANSFIIESEFLLLLLF